MGMVNRWYKMLDLLILNESVSINQMQEGLNLTPQTIRRSVDLLNDELNDVANILEKEAVFHLKIEDYDAFDKVMKGTLRQESDFNSSSKRIAYILNQLLHTKDYLVIGDITEELEVSRSTVNNDLREVRHIAKQYRSEIESIPNRGIKLIGEEFDLRLLYIHEVHDYFETEIIREDTLKFLAELEIEHQLGHSITNLLVKTIDVSLSRLNQSFNLMSNPQYYTNYYSDQSIREQLIYHIETNYKLSLGEAEIDFLCFPLNVHNIKIKHGQTDYHNNMVLVDLYRYMLSEIKRVFIVELDEERLFNEMAGHLFYLINRILFQVESSNLFYGEIEKKYPFSYKVAKIALKALSERLNRKVSPIEADYLALYFELVLRDDPVMKNKVAVVCHTGKGTAGMIHRQIQNIIGPNIEVAQLSEEDFDKENMSQYIAIISTVPVKNNPNNLPVIRLTNLFNDQFLNDEWRKLVTQQSNLRSIMSIDFTILEETEEIEEMIRQMSHRLTKAGLVDKGFTQRVLDREALQSTLLFENIYFPHAVNQLSDKIVLSFGANRLTHELVIMLAIPENINHHMDQKLIEIYDDIFRIANDQKMREDILKTKDLYEFIDYLNYKGVLM